MPTHVYSVYPCTGMWEEFNQFAAEYITLDRDLALATAITLKDKSMDDGDGQDYVVYESTLDTYSSADDCCIVSTIFYTWEVAKPKAA